jgi:O-methyltransferase
VGTSDLFRSAARPFAHALTSAASLFGRRLVTLPIDGHQDFQIFDRNELSAYWNRDRLVGLYENSMRATGMEWADNFSKRCRFYSLCQVLEATLSRCGDGDVIECGCWRGHSAHMTATILMVRGFAGTFHIFDSFEGLSTLNPEDKDERFNLSAADLQMRQNILACPEETVLANLADFPFVRTYKGWIPTRFPDVASRACQFVHIDVDLYEPIRDSIDFFYPRLVPSGAMVFDDYGQTQFPGAKRAIDEAVARFNPSFFYQVPTGGAFLIR